MSDEALANIEAALEQQRHHLLVARVALFYGHGYLLFVLLYSWATDWPKTDAIFFGLGGFCVAMCYATHRRAKRRMKHLRALHRHFLALEKCDPDSIAAEHHYDQGQAALEKL